MANRWIPLDGKKDPPADQQVLVVFKDNSWIQVTLRRIEFLGNKKKYVFGSDEDEWNDATHYMIVDLPENKKQ